MWSSFAPVLPSASNFADFIILLQLFHGRGDEPFRNYSQSRPCVRLVCT